ncbi:hypothetical protein HAX54_004460 [Datura stramonium]|uniref:Uncharacterized protein n=1 Tax=Datura stramonium TaxID=4076 RepID=A0ABS8T7Q8_DATST|nr:hypothetical protein [Datura stramonium]
MSPKDPVFLILEASNWRLKKLYCHYNCNYHIPLYPTGPRAISPHHPPIYIEYGLDLGQSDPHVSSKARSREAHNHSRVWNAMEWSAIEMLAAVNLEDEDDQEDTSMLALMLDPQITSPYLHSYKSNDENDKESPWFLPSANHRLPHRNNGQPTTAPPPPPPPHLPSPSIS